VIGTSGGYDGNKDTAQDIPRTHQTLWLAPFIRSQNMDFSAIAETLKESPKTFLILDLFKRLSVKKNIPFY
jgi:hypothetical protein